MNTESRFEVTLERDARSYSRDVGALYDRLQQLKQRWPGHRIVTAKKEVGGKVHVVVFAAKSAQQSITPPAASAHVTRWSR